MPHHLNPPPPPPSHPPPVESCVGVGGNGYYFCMMTVYFTAHTHRIDIIVGFLLSFNGLANIQIFLLLKVPPPIYVRSFCFSSSSRGHVVWRRRLFPLIVVLRIQSNGEEDMKGSRDWISFDLTSLTVGCHRNVATIVA